MREFEFYVQKGDVRRVSVDIALARSLKNDVLERAEKAMKLDAEEYAKMIFEGIYDSLREFCDMLLAADGFKSYSHEASISYLHAYGFTDAEIMALDRFRYKRNGSKYYGKGIDKEETEQIKAFYRSTLQKIKRIMDEKLPEKISEKRVQGR
ncbi:MAG TPA: hypothetical protein VJC16_00425 [Candidatus Nanoarchaeia archaeon]|nr:hypothetical protein [Candidatus Nanoarchaeia archaeon]